MNILSPILSDIFDTSPFLFGGFRGFRESMNADEEGLTITVALPGFEPEHVDIHAESGNAIVITAHAEDGTKEDWTSDYARRLVLPRGFAAEDAIASFKSGLLKIAVPRATQPQGKRIEITAGDQPAALTAE